MGNVQRLEHWAGVEGDELHGGRYVSGGLGQRNGGIGEREMGEGGLALMVAMGYVVGIGSGESDREE